MIFDLRFTGYLRFGKRINILGLAFLIFSLLLTSCEKRDSKLRQQLVGTWSMDEEHLPGMSKMGGKINFDANGTFDSHWGSARRVDYLGTWQVKDGVLQITSTNIDPHGITNVPTVGRIESSRIIQVDGSALSIELYGETNVFIRK